MAEMGRYKIKGEKKQSRIFLLLSIVFLIVMVKWGAPAFINFMAGDSKGRTDIAEEDIVPPQKPVISALPEAINTSEVTVSGYTEALASLDLVVDGEMVLSGKADDQGSFELKYSLSKGEHQISVKAKDEAENESESDISKIIFDPDSLEITINDPKDGSEIIGVNNKNIKIQGKVSKPDSTVKVGGSFALVDSEGNFSQTISLNEGENEIRIEAEDRAGNKVEKSMRLKYYP
jgi:bacillopeptidase F